MARAIICNATALKLPNGRVMNAGRRVTLLVSVRVSRRKITSNTTTEGVEEEVETADAATRAASLAILLVTVTMGTTVNMALENATSRLTCYYNFLVIISNLSW